VSGYLRRAPGRAAGLVGFLPALLSFLCGSRDHGELKSALIRHTLGGCSRADIDAWTASFVAQLRDGAAAGGYFADALAQIGQHRSQGAHLVLMSASTDLYVPAIGAALGFAEVICTGVRWEGGRLDGHLTTANRRGAEKARCLGELRRRHAGSAAAYGNAATDLDHLALVEHPLLVNGSARARSAAAKLGVPCAIWQ
jgi:phosphoserine phosphatase